MADRVSRHGANDASIRPERLVGPSAARPQPPQLTQARGLEGPRLAPTAAVAGHARPRLVIRPSRGWISLGLGEVWKFRELLFLIAWRDVKVRYKQTSLGFAWAIIPPLMTMLAFSLVFGGIAKIPSDGLPYPIFAYSGLLPWLYFAAAVGRGGTSLVSNSGLISKIYFPRLIVPLAAVLTPVADLALPGFIVLAMATALAVSLWLSAINVKYRDVGFGVAFLTQFWMYLSPLMYPVSLVPHKWRLLYSVNPMAGVIEGFRWGLLGNTSPDFGVMAVSAVAVAILLVGGLIYFKRTERTFVDHV
jgi:lipopolysaccharide transport system permease protein